MNGKTQLAEIIAELQPSLSATPYVFCSLKNGSYGDLAEAEPLACIREEEGLSVVIPQPQADRLHLSYDGVFQCLTLRVHSSLQSVGLSALLTKELAARGISANIIAGHYHDHLLVPAERASEALETVQNLQSRPPSYTGGPSAP